jgi:hypothetical protein
MMWLVTLVALAQPPAPTAPAPNAAADELSAQVLLLKRVFVDKFSGPDSAAQIRDMVIASLQRAKIFIVTENPERADAVLRGSGEDLIFTDTFQSSENTSATLGLGFGKGTSTRTRDSGSLRTGIHESDSTHIAERKHEASVSIRLVNKAGDVIWSTTQASQGSKFRPANADVAEKATRQLLQDLEKARTHQN